jgi:ring-1,2-phenylacetyl-CoA epoxidase subunit PaaD
VVAEIAPDLLPILREVKDPEIDVIDVVELGIVRRAIHDEGNRVTVTITPTYSGCPAMQVIETEIGRALEAHGYIPEVKTTFDPPWTTDWITDEAREKLRRYGIAPPAMTPSQRSCGGDTSPNASGLVSMPSPPHCPFCNSAEVELQSQFGSTACKALYTCHGCRQPFEHFKEF